jgi:hypothetical protein
MDYSMATPLYVDGNGSMVGEVIGQETDTGFQYGPFFSHGSILFDQDSLQPMRIPAGYDMLNDRNWDQRIFSMDEAACVAIGDTRARFPLLFELMRCAGAPAAQIARELLQREEAGLYYYVQVFEVDRSTGQMRNAPPQPWQN